MGSNLCGPNDLPGTQMADRDPFLVSTGILLKALSQQYPSDSHSSAIIVAGDQWDSKNYIKSFLTYSFYKIKYKKKEGDYQKKFKDFLSKSNFFEVIQKFQLFHEKFKNQGNDSKRSSLLLNYAMQEPSFLDYINQILSQTDDPKTIGYLTFILARLYSAIQSAYKTLKHNRQQIYIAAALNKQELETLKKIQNKNVILSFRSFVKGFTSYRAAKDKIKMMKQSGKYDKKELILFIVNFPQLNRLEPSVDSGFFMKKFEKNGLQVKQNVVFNLFQGFKVDKSEGNQFNLIYSHLSYLYKARQERIPSIDDSALTIYQMCTLIADKYLKTQSTLLRILKTQRQSIELSQILTHSNPNIEKNHSDYSSNLDQIQNLINIYIDQENYQKALEVANNFEQNFMIKAKKLKILYKSRKIEQAKTYLQSLLRSPERTKKQNQEAEEIIQYIEVLIDIEGNQRNRAEEKIKLLNIKMRKRYESSYEIVGKDVIACMEQLYRGNSKELNQEQLALLRSLREPRGNIDLTAINLRGISTTI